MNIQIVGHKYHTVRINVTNRMMSALDNVYLNIHYIEMIYKGFFVKEYVYDTKHRFWTSKGDMHFTSGELQKLNIFETKDEAIVFIGNKINENSNAVVSKHCRLPMSTPKDILKYCYRKYPEEMI